MNKGRVEGKVKDVAGRIERQAGEWSGDKEKQAHGAMKQMEGKVQNAWGKAHDIAHDAAAQVKKSRSTQETTDDDETAEDVRPARRKAS